MAESGSVCVCAKVIINTPLFPGWFNLIAFIQAISSIPHQIKRNVDRIRSIPLNSTR